MPSSVRDTKDFYFDKGIANLFMSPWERELVITTLDVVTIMDALHMHKVNKLYGLIDP